MKILIALSILQSICIIAVTLFFLQQEKQSMYLIEKNPHQLDLTNSNFTGTNRLPSAMLNENQIRQIIRDEFESAFAKQAPIKPPLAKQKKDVGLTSAALLEAKAKVSQEIDYYIADGEISPIEMSNLQAKIASLDTNGRKYMFAKLISAMNAGQLEGQL